MKKSLLFAIAGMVAVTGYAQVNSGSVVRVGNMDRAQQAHQAVTKPMPLKTYNQGTANKTTLGGSRWYNYVDHLTLLNSAVSNNQTLPYMWYAADMFGIYQGTAGLEADTIQFATYAMTFDPIDNNQLDFNDPTGYPGEINITSGNAYVLDSVTVWGVYGRNPNKTSVVDTLRLSFVYGNGGATNMPFYYFSDDPADPPPFWLPNFGDDTVRFGAIWHNPATNTALQNPNATAPTPAPIVMDVILDMNSVNDTNAQGWNVFSVPVNMSVPANNYVGMTVTFKTGELYTPWSDTVFRGSVNPAEPFKYGMFRPLFFEQNDNSYLSYTPGNWNMGHVKFLPETPSWDSLYVPAVAYTAPFAMEFPYIDFKVTCATCPTTVVDPVTNILKVEAYPNPANTHVVIPVTLTNSANVSVSLSNTLGQVLAIKDLGKVTSAKANFTTANLANGVYFYTVEAGGERSTGRIVVAH
jgi:hypothetical protein